MTKHTSCNHPNVPIRERNPHLNSPSMKARMTRITAILMALALSTWTLDAQYYVNQTNHSMPGSSTGYITLGKINLPEFQNAQFYFAWDNGITTQNLNNIPGGTYTCTITSDDPEICELIIVVTINTYCLTGAFNESPAVVVNECGPGNNGEIYIEPPLGESLTDYSYSWSNGEITPMITDLVAGNYCVTITNPLIPDCIPTIACYDVIYEDDCPGGNGLESQEDDPEAENSDLLSSILDARFNNESFVAFPNPFLDHVYLYKVDDVSYPIEITIWGMNGEKEMTLSQLSPSANGTIDLSSQLSRLGKGIHFLNIVSDNQQVQTLKIIKLN